jgi:hypothetical protein
MNQNKYPPPRFQIGDRIVHHTYSEDDFTGEITPYSLAGEIHGYVYNHREHTHLKGWCYFIHFDNGLYECFHESENLVLESDS